MKIEKIREKKTKYLNIKTENLDKIMRKPRTILTLFLATLPPTFLRGFWAVLGYYFANSAKSNAGTLEKY